MKSIAAWAALLIAGCVVDVDLGDAVPEPDQTIDTTGPALDAGPEVEPDARQPDVGPSPVLDAAPLPDAAPAPDAFPGEDPDVGSGPLDDCGECVAFLGETLECPEEQACLVDLELADICNLICGVPDDGSCEGCFEGIASLVDTCMQSAPLDVCRGLEAALVSRCDQRCFDDPCALCLADVPSACRAEAPFECTQTLADGFAACFGACDRGRAFDGYACAVDAGDAWTMCIHDVAGACDDTLAAEVDLCRGIAYSDLPACMGLCAVLTGLRQESCLAFGFDEALCAFRAAESDEQCIARCQGQAWAGCGPGGRTREAICAAGEGPACEGLGRLISLTCEAEVVEEGFCDGCLLQALVLVDGCEGIDGCLDLLEDAWAGCLDACGATGPAPGCLQCAAVADDVLGGCLYRGDALASCLSDRDTAALDCAGGCEDAIARAVPCENRTAALFGICGADPGDAACFERALLFDAACHWARLSVR